MPKSYLFSQLKIGRKPRLLKLNLPYLSREIYIRKYKAELSLPAKNRPAALTNILFRRKRKTVWALFTNMENVSVQRIASVYTSS